MFSENADYVDEQFRRWQADPNSVEPTWQGFFAGMQFAGRLPGAAPRATSAADVPSDVRVQTGVVRLVFWYRQSGHLQAHTDPLSVEPPAPNPLLQLDKFGLTESDLDRAVDGSMIFGHDGPIVLRDLVEWLEETYCRTIGVEYLHIDSLEMRKWLAERIEPNRNRPNLKLR